MNYRKTHIIAEVAQGYEGNESYANLFVRAAASAGADAVKFQLVYADELATPDYKHYELFKSLEMDDEVWENISKVALKSNIALYLDIFGEKSLNLAQKIGASAIKIHGTDIANKRLLLLVASSNISEVILGAGGAFQDEIVSALEILKNKFVIVLFGFQAYPTANSDNSLKRVSFALDVFSKVHSNFKVGFADHADPDTDFHLGLGALAIGLGAEVLEKHLTLSKSIKLEDYESALNPDGFLKYVSFIRECTSSIGVALPQKDFGMSDSELGYRKMIRRHVVSIKAISKGEEINTNNLALKRTSSALAITSFSDVEGKVALYPVSDNSPIDLKVVSDEH